MLCIGVVRVVGLLVVMVIDKRTRGSNYLISNPQSCAKHEDREKKACWRYDRTVKHSATIL